MSSFGRHQGAARRGNMVLYLALAGDVLVAIVKFAGAAVTGSSALLSEGVHSTVDAFTELLLLYGLNVARRPSTPDHQLGFGREVFFWNFIVALTILALGAGVALLDGIRQIMHPVTIESPFVSYGVLGLALLAEIPAMVGAMRNVDAKRGRSSFTHYVRSSRDPTSLTVLFGGGSGVLGLLVAATGTYLSSTMASPVWDGVASVLIAGILAVTALFLASNSKSLLIGVPASQATVGSILRIVGEHDAVDVANGAMTVHLAPDQILVALSVAFRASLTTAEIETAVAEIDSDARAQHPDIVILLLKPQSAAQFQELRRHRGW